ncbi:MAG: protein kinase [Planctomycetaceae bacterium]
MSHPDSDSPTSDSAPQTTGSGKPLGESSKGETHVNEGEQSSPVPDGLDEQAVTRICSDEEEAQRFSPSDDTFTAIQDLGLRLQAVPDHNVIGRVAHYDIIRCLGRGGMGTVFEAFDTRLFRPVAIKFMASSLAASPKARTRFLREARVAASINHPNVVTIHAVDEYDGRPYLVMEFVSGKTLHEHLRKLGALPLGDVLRISRQIATGLRAAHEKGIVHRDIKPGNILLENGVERVKIVDFGLAQVVFESSEITSQGQTLGTPRFMAPEQIEGSRVDERADLFSLGCVIYMMCCGHPPFSGNSITVLHNILRNTHVPVRQVMPQIPEALSDLADQLLSKTREGRIQSAAQVESVLNEIARAGTPSDLNIPALPSRSLTDVMAKENSRSPAQSERFHGIVVAAGATLLGLALIVLLWSPWKSQNKQDAPPQKVVSELSQDGSGGDSIAGSVATATDTTAAPPLVSRSPQTMTVGGAGADFPSLNAALLQVQPGDVLEIVGVLPADDLLLLNNPSNHNRITIEWKTDAPFEFAGGAPAAITIDSVQGVTIRGANVLTTNSHVVSVRGDCSGLKLENCRLEQAPGSGQAALVFWPAAHGTESAPMQIRNCEITFFDLGVVCIGSSDSAVDWLELNGNLLRGLREENGNALMLENFVSNFAVRHNRIAHVRAGLNVVGRWKSVEIANNTFFRIMECIAPAAEPISESISISANLAIQCPTFVARLPSAGGSVSFDSNKTDSTAEISTATAVSSITFRSTDSANAEFLSPLPNDQLVISSAPHYAGAVEPQP